MFRLHLFSLLYKLPVFANLTGFIPLVVCGVGAGWPWLHSGRTGLGQGEGLLLVAWTDSDLEGPERTRGHEESGVVWRWNVLRGKGKH